VFSLSDARSKRPAALIEHVCFQVGVEPAPLLLGPAEELSVLGPSTAFSVEFAPLSRLDLSHMY
jgi:hypothetical protein